MERNNYRRNGGADAGRGRVAGGDEGRGGGGGRGRGYYNQQQQHGQYQGGAGGRGPTQMANNPRPAQGYRPVQGATNVVRPISSGGPVNQMGYGPLPAQQRGYRPVQAQRPPAVRPQQQLTNNPPASQPWGNRPVHAQRPPAVGPQQQLATNPPASQPWGYRPVMGHDQGGSRSQVTGHGARPAGSFGAGGSWSSIAAGNSAAGNWRNGPPPSPPAVQTRIDLPDIQSLSVSEQQPPSLEGSEEGRIVPMKRPASGGKYANRSVMVQINCFTINFNPHKTIIQYDVEFEPEKQPQGRFVKKSLKKSDRCLIWKKLFANDPSRFPEGMAVFDGQSVFSTTPLPTGKFKLDLLDGEEVKAGSYVVTIKFANESKYSILNDCLSGIGHNAREVLHGLDVVFKANISQNGITFGRSTFPTQFRREDDLRCGVAAFRGSQQSVKLTSQGLGLLLDTTVLPFRKSIPVIHFLKENVYNFRGVNDVNNMGREVERALKGLKVTVTHRDTRQKFTIMGLTRERTRVLSFPCVDREGKVPTTHVKVVDYFMQKYGKDIVNKDIPCLMLGTRKDAVPMEFCVLADGQKYPKEKLDDRAAKYLRDISLVSPKERKNTICEIVQSEYGPRGGEIVQNFGFKVDTNMTRVTARVLDMPIVKLGNGTAKLDKDKCQWNLLGKSFVAGVPIQRWILIDFSSEDQKSRLNQEKFIYELMNRCKNLGVRMENPLRICSTNMDELRSVDGVRHRLGKLNEEVSRDGKGRLQIIVCVMAYKAPGYDLLKLVSETEIGVLTQCCLSENANKERNDQFLANLALKMNAKVGGSNFELVEPLPGLEGEDHVMFIGADVNHPAALNATSPSIAAVVATVNWPAVNRYAARVRPQAHRKEQIMDFGSMCLDLVNTYARLNKVKPRKIVIFRDGVSDGQFDMVLNDELLDFKNAIYGEHYKPDITLIVAQKRHHTRLFLENERDGSRPFNVPPGTVVDSTITHPTEFDFFLCSHFGGLGTSKSTHYQALWDKHHFTADQLQKLIYDLCFTFARCTKPVSLVPPVYYADLVAYRGRLYHDAAMELQSRASVTSSSSKTSSSSSSAGSFDNSFFKVHPNLQDSMFFV